MSVEFPLRASGVASIKEAKLQKMEVAVKIHIHELKSQHPLPRASDPTMGLDNNVMFESPKHYLSRAGTALSRNRPVGREL